jgi:hypothetical protein
VRGDGGHEDHAILPEMIFGELVVVPYPDVSLVVVADEGVVDGEGAHAVEEFMEADEGLTEGVESLFVTEVASVDESEGQVFGKNGDVPVVGAEVGRGVVVSSVDLNQRFFRLIPIVVSIEFFILVQLGIVLYQMFLGEISELVLVDLVVLVLLDELPGESWERVNVATHKINKNYYAANPHQMAGEYQYGDHR